MWLDMNEPAVFETFGMTFPNTNVHIKADGTEV